MFFAHQTHCHRMRMQCQTMFKHDNNNSQRTCAWNSSVFNGTGRSSFRLTPLSKCGLRQEQILIGVFALDPARERISYPTGKAKAETRVFVDCFLRPEEVIPLPLEERKHLRVRRFRNGDELVLFNSSGQTAAAVYQNETAVVVELRNSKQRDQSFSSIIAIPRKPSRADWLVEKLTELGTDSIYFMHTKRTVVNDPSQNRLQRWKRIAISASKQSLRDSTPSVLVLDFETALGVASQHPLSLLLCPNGKPLLSGSVLDSIERKGRVLSLVGPEGGFDAEEIDRLMTVGVVPVSLGRNRLRTETAAVASAAILSQLIYQSSCERT